MAKTRLPGQGIGIIGSGMTAYSLLLEAKRMGYHSILLTDKPDQQVAKLADQVMAGSLMETEKLIDLANQSDVLVFESDQVDIEPLASVKGYLPMPQLSDMLSITQDRLIEKVFLESLNINVTPYATITSLEDLQEAVKSIGFPCVLKAIRVEANQIPNMVLYSEEDFYHAERMLKTGSLLLESWVAFDKELTMTAAVDGDGQVNLFPLVEKVVGDGKLLAVHAPARVSNDVNQAVQMMAHAVAGGMALVGLVTIELFMTPSGMLYVKRVGVNPQEANHFLSESCAFSQYEALIRLVCHLPLPELTPQRAVTIRYLYREQLDVFKEHFPLHPEWKVTFYPSDNEKANKAIGYVVAQVDHIEDFDRKWEWE